MFPMGAGEGVQRATVLPVPTDWGRGPPIWVTDRCKNQMALFPPSLLFLGLRWSSTSRENTLARGSGFRAPSGGLAFAEHWVNYLESKTEDKEVAMVAWACTLVPLPHFGTHFQKAIGSVLIVFFIGFETRPMGKQREFLLKRKAARCFQLTWISMESLKRRMDGEMGAYLNSAFGNAKLSGQSFSAIPG